MLDYFGKNASDLRDKRLWLLDMDGTIYQEEQIFEGTLDFLRAITDSGGEYVFITNNSSKSVVDYLNKVHRMGIRAEKENFFTSAQATILFLQKNYPGAKVYCEGTRSLILELQNAGIDVTEQVEPVDIVLMGFDMELTSQKLRNTCEILTLQDVVYIATNPDWVYPVSFGFVPDCGSICSMVKNATGKYPKFIGKPEPTMIDIVREQKHRSAEETVVVGDRLYTDIAAGVNAGVTSIAVLSGESTVEDILKDSVHPTYTFRDVREIYNIIR